jgi:hypothetical protein
MINYRKLSDMNFASADVNIEFKDLSLLSWIFSIIFIIF